MKKNYAVWAVKQTNVLMIFEGYAYFEAGKKINSNFITSVELGSANVPAGVKRALLFAVNACFLNTPDATHVSGSAVKSVKTLYNSGAYFTRFVITDNIASMTWAQVYDIELTGNAGTISVSFSGGSNARANNYVLLFLQ